MDTSKVKVPSLKRLVLEPLGVTELINALPTWGLLESLPQGNGEPVMVVPGLTTNDMSTIPLRKFLEFKGFSVYGWDQGLNIKYSEKLEKKLLDRIEMIAQRHQQKVTLIGWSLGGITIRLLAKHNAEYIKQIIPMGAPFSNLAGKTYVSWWYALLAQETIKDFNQTWLKEIEAQPDVPSTAIYSKTDGMVSWEYCMEWTTGPKTQNIEVLCNHLGFGMTPSVWAILVDRILQDENDWQLFDESKLKDIEAASYFHV